MKFLPLILLFLICNTQSLSPANSPTHPPTRAPPVFPPTSLPPSPAIAGPDCATALLNLTACLTYVEQGANLTLPAKGCCPSLASLVDNNPICLCQLLSNSNPLGFKIDVTRALMLPTACNVTTPDVSLCNALGIPVASPGALSPGGGGAGEPSGLGPSSQPTSIAAAPSAGGDGMSTAGITSLKLALLAIISQMILALF